MKRLFTVMAWVGILLLVLAVTALVYADIYTLDVYNRDGIFAPNPPPAVMNVGWFLSIISLIFTLIGGLSVRSKYLWPVLIVTGVIFCILSIYPVISWGWRPLIVLTLFIYMAPGLITAAEGLIIRWYLKRKTVKA
jgi:hypothetical protein